MISCASCSTGSASRHRSGCKGPDAIAALLSQLEGFDVPAAAWETEVLPARMAEYDPAWLDEQCLAGRIVWTRLAPRTSESEKGAAPVRSTPIALLARRNVRMWSAFADQRERAPLTTKAQQVFDFMREHGASFFDELVDSAGLMQSQVEEALAELVALGLVNSDSFGGLRALLLPSDKRKSPGGVRRRGRMAIFGMQDAGRWTIVRRGPAGVERGAWDRKRRAGSSTRVGVHAARSRFDRTHLPHLAAPLGCGVLESHRARGELAATVARAPAMFPPAGRSR